MANRLHLFQMQISPLQAIFGYIFNNSSGSPKYFESDITIDKVWVPFNGGTYKNNGYLALSNSNALNINSRALISKSNITTDTASFTTSVSTGGAISKTSSGSLSIGDGATNIIRSDFSAKGNIVTLLLYHLTAVSSAVKSLFNMIKYFICISNIPIFADD